VEAADMPQRLSARLVAGIGASSMITGSPPEAVMLVMRASESGRP